MDLWHSLKGSPLRKYKLANIQTCKLANLQITNHYSLIWRAITSRLCHNSKFCHFERRMRRNLIYFVPRRTGYLCRKFLKITRNGLMTQSEGWCLVWREISSIFETIPSLPGEQLVSRVLSQEKDTKLNLLIPPLTET